jgi:hypothetical protein
MPLIRKQNYFAEKLAALPVNDTIFFEYKISTKGRAGMNKLNLSFNPDYDQPEQFLYNNVWQRSFFVVKDDQNPLLERLVSWHGVRISDNDSRFG